MDRQVGSSRVEAEQITSLTDFMSSTAGDVLHIVVAVAVDVEIIGIDPRERRLRGGMQNNRLEAAADRLLREGEHVLGRELAETGPGGEKADLDRFVQR